MTGTRDVPFNPSYVGPRAEILRLVPDTARAILDIGCSTGTLARQIKERSPSAMVAGIEMDPAMARVAAGVVDKVAVGDVETMDLEATLGRTRFDCIIMADLLEHLRDPWTMLRRAAPFLEPRGALIASIPNVRHYDTVINLVVRGIWPYRDRGIHDRTHLRFFARKNIADLFGPSGLRVERIVPVYRIIERPYRVNAVSRFFALPGFRGFLAFQYLVVARPAAGGTEP